jgi:hypothetical protein
MSARNGHALALWRRLRAAGRASAPPPLESVPPLASMPSVVVATSAPETLPEAEPPRDLNAEKDNHRDRGVLDIIAEEAAQITGGHIENRLRETLRTVGAVPAPVEYCPECPYPIGSIGCRNTHGGAV